AKAGMTYRTEDGYRPIENLSSPHAKVLPDWAPAELKELDEDLPQQLDFGAGEYSGEGGQFTRNGRTISTEDARL
ncbi:DNA-directed RNA polymerase subunit beta', partial [gut metagenome]